MTVEEKALKELKSPLAFSLSSETRQLAIMAIELMKKNFYSDDNVLDITKIDNGTFMVAGNYVKVSNVCGSGCETVYKCQWLNYEYYIKSEKHSIKLLNEGDFKFIPLSIKRATIQFILSKCEVL